VDLRDDLERRVRSAAVRVEERLALLRILAEDPEAASTLARRRAELLEAVRSAARSVRESLP
jgi:hypothetical protein